MAEIPLKGKANLNVSLTTKPDLMITFNFASQHMGTAIKFAKQAEKIENENHTEEKSNFFDEMRTYVSSTIIMSVCALEANINEHFLSNDGILKDYKPDDRGKILEIIDSYKISEKYQMGLILNKKPLLIFDKEPFESFQYLIKFRNSLVHYKPETDKDFKVSKQLEKNLKCKFDTNPHAKPNNSFLGYHAMSYSCAKWAVNTALLFCKAYSEMLGIYDKFPRYQCV